MVGERTVRAGPVPARVSRRVVVDQLLLLLLQPQLADDLRVDDGSGDRLRLVASAAARRRACFGIEEDVLQRPATAGGA
jgi:hypothetical protein